MLLSIGYASRPICEFTEIELAELWECCSENNERHGITGALYYDEAVFFHVLEGEAEMLEAVFAQIKKDPRHLNVEIVLENDIASRSFHRWPMKFIDGRSSPALQERFAPEALASMRIADLNSNAFMLARL